MTKKPILLIIAGALASIADEPAQGWYVDNEASFPPAMLSDQTPALRYAVHAELHGPGPFTGDTGWLDARFTVTPAQPIATTTITITSVTRPDIMPATGTVPADRMIEDTYMDAWLDCTADPCVEDFEVTVSRDASSHAPLMVTGTAISQIGGMAKEAPPNSSITVTVTGPL